MKRKELLATYIPIANFIAAMDKEHCEVVIHDVRDLEHSIFYVTEPSLTFRYRGNGMPEFARKLIENKQYLRKSHIVNYLSESAQKTFRSSTFFIMDGKELAGLMCVNTEIGYLLKGIETMKEAIVMNPYGLSTIQEFGAGTTVGERMEAIFDRMLLGKAPEDLRISERRYIVSELYKDGVFSYKGKVAEVARRLDVSEKTVYRYLRELEE